MYSWQLCCSVGKSGTQPAQEGRSYSGGFAMVTVSDVRLVALSLPYTTEGFLRDYRKFRIGPIVYASVSPDERRMGFGFPKEERAGLVASDPVKFAMPAPAD